MLALTLQPGPLLIARHPAPGSVPPLPGPGWNAPITSLSRTPEAWTLVCPASDAAALRGAGWTIASDSGGEARLWHSLRVDGTLPFGATGVLASISAPLAQAGVSIYAVSTFDTDDVLVQSRDVGKALVALQKSRVRVGVHPALRERVSIREACFPRDREVVAELMREYAGGLGFSLDYQGFEDELAALPGKYADPDGVVLLAEVDGLAAGCVALRRIPAGAADPVNVCEMKRMFVRPAFRGVRAGRRMGEALLAAARARGYALMKLDSEEHFVAAVSLYRSLGFSDIPRYNDDPMQHTIWMACRL